MKKETFEKYREKALEYYGKHSDLSEHVQKVEEISLLLCDIAGINDENDRQIISMAALLHDVGKSKKHNKIAADFVMGNCFFEKDDCDKKREDIAEIIEFHRGNIKKIKGDNSDKRKLIAIVRLADKISKIYKIKDFEKIKHTTDALDDSFSEISKWLKEG